MIDGKTRLLGLLGQPVEHSLSPAMHNAALIDMGLNWSYLPLHCSSGDLENVLNALRGLNFIGLNVTIPHKQSVAKMCAELTPLAQKIGAVNTLLPNDQEGWIGTNTDVEGFVSPLKKNSQNWEGLNAVIIGCGGSAKAVVAGLEELRFAKISIVSRNPDSLKRFLNDVQLNTSKTERGEPITKIAGFFQEDRSLSNQLKKADLIVNATPVGMTTKSNEISKQNDIPLGPNIWDEVSPQTTLYDLIYTPNPSPWLAWGAKRGFHCINGLEMLVQQGASSLRLWSGTRDVPVNKMREAAQSSLNN